MTFKDNFEKLCAIKGLAPTTAMKKIGVSYTTYLGWSDSSKPRPSTIKKISDYFGVSQEWLMADHGKTLSEKDIASAFDKYAPADIPNNEKRLPVYGSISAGRGVLAEEDIIGWAYADEEYHDGEHFWLSVKGVSMEPDLKNGDLVLIHKQPCLDGGQIGAFIFGDEGFVKKYLPSDDGIHLHSLNPAFPDIIVSPDNYEQFHIIGRIIESRHKY